MSTAIGPCTSGALSQIVALGQIDSIIKGSQHTLWRSRFLRSTNFAAEAARQNFATSVEWGGSGTVNISRAGDLIHNIYMVAELPALQVVERKATSQPWVRKAAQKSCQEVDDEIFKASGKDLKDGKSIWRSNNYGGAGVEGEAAEEITEVSVHYCNAVGMHICQQVDLLIGGSLVDSLTSGLLWCYSELCQKSGVLSLEATMKRYDRASLIADSSVAKTLYVALPFFFQTHPGSALSLCSLSFHQVSLNFRFAPLDECVCVNIPKNKLDKHYEVINPATGLGISPNDLKVQLLTQYIYCDEAEREAFSSKDWEQLCLCHQIQKTSASSKTVSMPLNFNHAIVELWFYAQRQCAIDNNEHFNFSGVDNADPIRSARLLLNNQARFNCPAEYMRLITTAETHSRIPEAFIYCLPFAIQPETWWQPSGSLNASRIDSLVLDLEMQADMDQTPFYITCHARSLNCLRFRSGLGGLSFCN